MSHPPARLLASVVLVSAAVLAFEINLTRLFSVAQFYHFAFMVVSLALLGSGASGSFLALLAGWKPSPAVYPVLGWLCGGSILAGYLFINHAPFNAFTLAWDASQLLLMAANFLALALPFFFSGMLVSLLFSAYPGAVRRVYAANLAGAALGCLAGLAAPAWLGGEGVVTLAAGLASLGALAAALSPVLLIAAQGRVASRNTLLTLLLPAAALLAFSGFDQGARLFAGRGVAVLDLRLSPYKNLSYALQLPGAQHIYQRWNAYSRVDVVRSPSIRSLPGLSYRYTGALLRQDGLTVDGDDLSSLLLPAQPLDFTAYLPTALAYHLRPASQVLILDPAGGLEILNALANGATRITAAQPNPLILEAAHGAYAHPQVRVEHTSGRSYLMRTGAGGDARFEVIVFALSNSFHPVRSGAFSLAENYLMTSEAAAAALQNLKPGGLLVIPRWLQTPPSEELRAFALAVTALEQSGMPAADCLAAYRGYNTLTVLVKKGAFSPEEKEAIRAFAESRAFDLVYLPGIRPEETNRYNVLPQPVYFSTFTELLAAQPRESFYRAYPFDVRPPSDDRPFFANYFKWSQSAATLQEFGHTWQPFGGGGYFILVGMLALSILFSLLFILLPVLAARARRSTRSDSLNGAPSSAACLVYFGSIGAAFMLVEIPLIQRFILFLEQPVIALAVVLFSLLAFSGIGSLLSRRIPAAIALAGLALLLFLLPLLLPNAMRLELPLTLRVVWSGLLLAPLGCLMGMAFPSGLNRIHQSGEANTAALIPWIWAVNGSASVVSAVAAALLSLSFGFTVVFLTGAAGYTVAWLTWMAAFQRPPTSGTKRTSPRL